MTFDPYRKWLGIPEGARPPSHYQLLAISPQEKDRDVIETAAVRQSAFVRNYQKGAHVEEATRLLNEIAAAKLCLLDPQKRVQYDAALPAAARPKGRAIDDVFDAYYEFLDIPPADQPPTHYRLLGLEPFVSDVQVILAAYETQKARLTKALTPERKPWAQRLLDEMRAAKLALLDPVRRAAYDTVLRSATSAFALEAPTAVDPRATAAAANRPIRLGKEGVEFIPWGSLKKYKLLEAVPGPSHVRTHRAQHLDTDRYYYLKFVAPESLGNSEIVKRFERECEILTQLDHPNLIVGHETFQNHGQRFLVMEYVVGTDLGTLVNQQGPLPVDVAVDYMLQAARGLRALHAGGVFHRNIKPQILLVDLQGRLRITNLLLAKIGDTSLLPSEELTTTGEAMGTVDYLPPEQAVDARKADARSDIYALGCTLHHLLAGRSPFGGKGAMQKILAHRQSPPPSLTALRPAAPAWLDAVFQRCMAKKPEERYPSADELIAALEKGGAPPVWRRVLRALGVK